MVYQVCCFGVETCHVFDKERFVPRVWTLQNHGAHLLTGSGRSVKFSLVMFSHSDTNQKCIVLASRIGVFTIQFPPDCQLFSCAWFSYRIFTDVRLPEPQLDILQYGLPACHIGPIKTNLTTNKRRCRHPSIHSDAREKSEAHLCCSCP
jgi:hypothetical protein